MIKFLLAASIATVLAASLALASEASTGTTTIWLSMTFAEPIVPGVNQGCPISPIDGLCGSGEVMPFGHATETVLFGGCGDGCDSRTINLANGSIFIDESFSNPNCPGVCGSRGTGQPASGTITDVIVGGTDHFSGATGNLTGSVHAAGTAGVAKLSGTIMLPA